MELEPITRKEQFLAAAAGMDAKELKPITREEMFLAAIAENCGSGGGTDSVDLTEYVRFSDYASTSKTGTVKINSALGVNIDNNGTLRVFNSTIDDIDKETVTYRPLAPNHINRFMSNYGISSKLQIHDMEQDIANLKQYHETVVYGWHVNPNESDPFAAVTYLADAIGMTPAKMGAEKFDYGSWRNPFFMPKPCMLRYDGTVAYYLDPNDYRKKIDGTPSDIADSAFGGNAMMEWPLIWYKFAGGEQDGEGYFYVSNRQVDDSYHCWCNTDSKNNITQHFYTAIYNGTGTEKMRSLSGVMLTPDNGNGNTTATQEITRAIANNVNSNDVEWYIDVYADRLLINALLVLIGKSLNTQATFGRGLDTGGQTAKESYVTGALDAKGLFYGVTSVGTSAVKVFGMENWWGCVWRRTAGCISVERALKVKLTYGNADSSDADEYNTTGAGYIKNGTIPDTSAYASKMNFNECGYMTSEVKGSSSTYYCDNFNQNTGTRYLLAGGSAASGFGAGAFCFLLNGAASSADWSISAAISCKTLANKEV